MLKRLYRFLNPSYQSVFLDYKVDPKPRYGHGKPAHKELFEIINNNRAEYLKIISKSFIYLDRISEIKDSKIETDSSKPSWNNGFLPGLDIIALYTMVAEYKPRRYVEIGSGNSTKVAYKAKMDQELETEIVSIDPHPRAEIDDLANRVYREPFEKINFNILDELDENDILFIDNSHRILPNSDSMVFFLEILPKLKKGVIVHIHDIYLPFDYPEFMCNRFYSEQYGLAIFLLANSRKYNTILPCYFISEDDELSNSISEMWQNKNMLNVERHGGSFWLQITE
jgi:hypothetical protein